MLQFPIDCLNDIIEYLEDDSNTLYSCLLVNRSWCKISVRIYWRYIRNLSTLISCLPNDSKEILYNNGISISTSKTPVFNYASFCKYLEVRKVIKDIEHFLRIQDISVQNLNDITIIVLQEIFKLLMCQTSSLRELRYTLTNLTSITFTSYPGARECLKNLSTLSCSSNIHPEFFYKLSKICQTSIHTLSIILNELISNGLADLISSLQNLRHLKVYQHKYGVDLTDINTLISKFPNSLITFSIYRGMECFFKAVIPLSFIARFTNLQELVFIFSSNESYEGFNKLQYVVFPQLQNLKFYVECPENELLIKFLENNGKNLKEFYVKSNDNSLNLAIVKFCPNLRNLTIRIEDNELEILETILISCKYLESIRIFGYKYYNKKGLTEIIMKYSSNIKLFL
ncbi:unnamed protein product [Rhizophagus irregularis]|uniref:F-box domain-containing protein n=1 Tax=Rhizophagus irregularis TaxID=588596 RepID=A0A2N1N1E0_9GLOM|nr:hypothetical protein RhiirC2_851978 [Rhizophagus irregularis]CAB4381694.1 unnamed protein product [Rhizophagus irregularis]CAB5314150.1 unnamed protein product [Rhizophagus irregularis]